MSRQVGAEPIWFARKNADSLEASAASAGAPISPGRTKKGKKSPKKRNSGGGSSSICAAVVKSEPNSTPLPPPTPLPVPEMSTASAACEDKVKMEVWFHESCVIWAPGVCLVPPRLVGLDEAIADSHQSVCGKYCIETKIYDFIGLTILFMLRFFQICQHCHKTGANIFCRSRGCGLRTHFPCAVSSCWLLDEDKFMALCPGHKDKDHQPPVSQLLNPVSI